MNATNPPPAALPVLDADPFSDVLLTHRFGGLSLRPVPSLAPQVRQGLSASAR
jgi:hypothetical protein